MLARLVFRDKSDTTASGYVAKFQTILFQMKLEGSPFTPELAHATFMSKINHSAFGSWKEIMNNTDEADIPLESLYTKFYKRL